MAKRAFIIHGWDGYPEEGWFPWLEKELVKHGFIVEVPAMPDTRRPAIQAWVARINNLVGTPDEQTFLVGHSIGAQAILRYVQTLDTAQRIGGAVFVGGWVRLAPAAYEDEDDAKIAKPWLDTPIDWARIKSRAGNFTAIFSDNDPFVPLSDVEVFRNKLDAEIILEHEKGHFSGSDDVTELSSALRAVLKHAGSC